MKKLTLLSLLLATLLLPVSGMVYADNCGASFDHAGACGRNCMAVNPACGMRGCLALCSGSSVPAAAVATSQTTAVAAVNTNGVAARRAVTPGTGKAAGVNRGAINRSGTNRNGGVNRAGARR